MKIETAELKQLNIQNFQLKLVGTSPLIMHKWSDKAKKEMLDKQMKKTKTAKLAKDPQADYESSMYRDSDGDPCFPSVAFKSAAVDAAISMDLKKTNMRQSFHVLGEMVKIVGEPSMREDMVRVGMGTADIRYRAEFKKWSCVLDIRFNAAMISVEQIVNLFQSAGFGIGVGEWRPQKNGSYGMFEVATK